MSDARAIDGTAQLLRLTDAIVDLTERHRALAKRITQHRLFCLADLPAATAETRALADGLEALLAPRAETPLRWPITPKEDSR